MASQRGMCDIGCDLPCDGGGCDLPEMPNLSKVFYFLSKVFDIFSYCDCSGCDWPSRKTSILESKEKDVYIPPKTTAQSERKEQT
ncbi:MAG: hypothetical protein ACOH2K_18030 [Burkholderiaceae bacterium]